MVANSISDIAGPVPEAVKPHPVNVPVQPPAAQNDKDQSSQIEWHVVAWFCLLHLGAIYGLSLLPTAQAYTLMWGIAVHLIAAVGVTAGTHRLWTHRSYKARLPLRVFLAIGHSIFSCVTQSIVSWARDHRAHHKYTDTDADPHNAKRGFFFAHLGWNIMRKHPDVIAKGKQINMSDVISDPVVQFQTKFLRPLAPLLLLAGSLVPLLWGESVSHALFICGVLRYAFTPLWLGGLSATAHMLYDVPSEKNINALVSLFSQGEGGHSYHHIFAEDYSASELGWKAPNPTTAFIDFMARVGQAYDLKQVSPNDVRARAARTGDGCPKEHAQ